MCLCSYKVQMTSHIQFRFYNLEKFKDIKSMQIPGGFPGDSQTAQLASGVSQPDLRPPALRHQPVGVRGTVRLLQVSPSLVPVVLQKVLPLR